MTLSDEDDDKLLQQLKTDFNEHLTGININQNQHHKHKTDT